MLLVAAYWRTDLTLRQLAPLFGISKSAADRSINHLGPLRALQPRQRFRRDTALIVDGTLVPTRDHQVVIDADTRLAVAVGRPLPGNRSECKALELSGAESVAVHTTVIADGGYRGTGLVIPHRRERGKSNFRLGKRNAKPLTAKSALIFRPPTEATCLGIGR